MNKEEMAEAIERVLTGFSCPEIETVVNAGTAVIGVQSRDGERFFVEVKDV